MHEPETSSRKYFTVVDEHGRAMPAVEYWAGTFDTTQPQFEIVPLRRFIKLIGTGESLREDGDGVLRTAGSGQRFFRLQTQAQQRAAG